MTSKGITRWKYQKNKTLRKQKNKQQNITWYYDLYPKLIEQKRREIMEELKCRDTTEQNT